VDYGEVHRMARDIVEGPPVQLIETLAESIAAGTLDEHPAVEAVKVRVAKPHVRLDDTVLSGSAVEILRRREAEPES
jgi:7,8-dihydroneopterin aldolase/epimerase/oxygenase